MKQNEIRNILKWLERFYSGEGREFPSKKGEAEQEYAFFDPRFRHLAARWYRKRFDENHQEPTQPAQR